ncbi:hypothetical protein DEU56DRAFT_980918 [Suillus clintonianus]|uniref:uncharacterized protein n=1 Tax=Suillus clintonianus TaxID=1904413 RepID=UPI001B8752BB|nr:uncharacterized protein DEU56DRAFT_980918 [Suillus clintonianus]KAG2135962.1 hypothetical protein DEU56DRAFT_980918 [Suillus clintonianus]
MFRMSGVREHPNTYCPTAIRNEAWTYQRNMCQRMHLARLISDHSSKLTGYKYGENDVRRDPTRGAGTQGHISEPVTLKLLPKFSLSLLRSARSRNIGGMRDKQALFVARRPERERLKVRYRQQQISRSQLGQNQPHAVSSTSATPPAPRKAHIEVLLESLEYRDAEIRFTNARRLFYVLQGTFAETTSPEHQLHWIYENCKVVRGANGLSTIVESMKIASQKHDLLCSLSDADTAHFQITPTEKAGFLRRGHNRNLVYLGMMYHLIEIFKERDDFADELMSMDPPLPTFTPPPVPPTQVDLPPIKPTPSKLAQAYSPIPVRHHYHHDDADSQHSGLPSSLNRQPFQSHVPNPGYRPGPQPATPAPFPPPSPKPKKQFGPNNDRFVPFAIDEADKLYNRHMYVSLSLWQMWKTREECMTAESGLDCMTGSEGDAEPLQITNEDLEIAEPLLDVALLDAKITEAVAAIGDPASPAQERKARERKEDFMRLKRSAVSPVLSGWATVSAGTGQQQVPQSSTSSVFPLGVASPPEQPPAPPPTLDDLDVTRHREITSKAVSAILLLTLKWFKASHVMKFHHIGQLLLDTNCLLLILKMFGLQEVSSSVVSKADSHDHNFFRYCQIHHAKIAPRPQDDNPLAGAHVVLQTKVLPNGQKHEEEVEMLTEFSWRNFFSTINFAKIMQKLSKSRSHRIWMLVQCKSSAVLKRVLRVSHPLLQLHVLKLIKSQVPFCGRKWRQCIWHRG